MMKHDARALWNAMLDAGGLQILSGFNKVWYEKKELNPDETEALQKLYAQFPLDEANFKAWLRQRTRQVYENAVRAELETHYASKV